MNEMRLNEPEAFRELGPGMRRLLDLLIIILLTWILAGCAAQP